MDIFEIPSHISELDIIGDTSVSNIIANLNDAKANSRDGPEYIIEYSNAYFTTIVCGDKLALDVLHTAYETLNRSIRQFNERLPSILSTVDEEETRLKYLNLIKMLLYCYTQIIIIFEQKKEATNMSKLKKIRKEPASYCIDKKEIVVHLNNILQQEIKQLWNPPIVEESFINMVSEVCYRFLQNPLIKNMKPALMEIWSFLGTLITNYNHGKTFVIRVVQLIKMHEHLIHCLPEGFKFLAETFNCKSLIHDVVCELTEWQADESYQDAQGGRFCSLILVEMAVIMPSLMIPEVFYLDQYLYNDAPTLRTCVLTVMAEVILKVLTKHQLTDEEKTSRDDIFFILMEHIEDCAAVVRSKVIQQWARLQEENAIPVKILNQVLEKVVVRLFDKGALPRKSAAACITKFLSHNPYSSDLQLSKRKMQLVESQEKLTEYTKEHTKDLETRWQTIENDIREIIKAEFAKEAEDIEMPEDDFLEVVKTCLREGNFHRAVQLSRSADEDVPEWKAMGAKLNADGKVAMTLQLLHNVYLVPEQSAVTEEYLQNLDTMTKSVEFLQETVQFLSLIDSAIPAMTELLDSATVCDMHEAIEFFTVAYHFNIDNAEKGIFAMLKLMQRNEQERKDAIVKAFHFIYLNTDTKNITEHATIIVQRLITLLKLVPVSNWDDVQSIISEWSSKGTIDNSVIDMLWQFFTRRITVSEEDSRAALELLRMVALKRYSIINRNMKLIATVTFEKDGGNDMLLVGAACRALAVAGREKIDVNSKKPPMKVNIDDDLFKDLIEILARNFFKDAEFYLNALADSVNCIYRLCSKPSCLCETLLKRILTEMIKLGEEKCISQQTLVKLCHFLGCIAINHLDFMDNTLYKELKRRNNIRQQRKDDKNSKKKTRKSNTTNNSSINNTNANDESVLEGASAEDADAEFILHVLENDTVNGSGLLGKLSFVIKTICERPDIYENEVIQSTAVIALIRFMLVSSTFCEDNMQLLFTIFEKTKYPDVKCSILVHCSDLITRFPNIVDPWMPKVYQSLQDPLEDIRKVTFFTLANLILRDLIRVHGFISAMAKCIIDDSASLNCMSRTFFVELSHKENNLYNILPDIFSHLLEMEDLSSENLRIIIKFQFDLIDKQKYMENLVDRFCSKFRGTENVDHCRNIAYCLTLINYNEKALKKLLDNFPTYKHLVHDEEIYASFKEILGSAAKVQPLVKTNNLKSIIAEIEQNIESVFEITEGGPPKPAPPAKTPKRQPKKKARRGRKNTQLDSDSD